MASKAPGSKVILCTDGLANSGVGELPDYKGFYNSIALFNREHSVAVSVVTMEGEDCRMESIGTGQCKA